MELQGLTINFLGDSITQGVGASGPDTVYHAVLKANTGLKEARNYGIGGTRLALQKGTVERRKDDYVDVNSFVERYEAMEDADAVVVFGGTNDYGHGDAPLGTMDDRTPDTFYGACHTLFCGLIQKYLGKPVVIMTPLHRAVEKRFLPDSKTQTRTLKMYVDAIRQVAEFYALPVLDLYAASGIQPQIEEVKAYYMPDGLHPNDNGNAVIAHKLQKFLENL